MENQENISKKEQYDLKKQEKQTNQEKRRKNKKIRSILIWTIGVVVIIAAVFVMVKLANKSNSNPTGITIDAIAPTDQVKGNPDAKLILTEYSDFQCPACSSYVPFIKSALDEYGDRVAFVYRHFPLSSIHPHAEPAARAAEAAGEQDAFWPMHDILFEEQSQWSAASRPKTFFLEYAEKLNLNLAQFEADYASEKIKDKVEADRQSGLRARINSTPTFFINGNKIKNPRSADELKALLNAALNVLEVEETIDTTSDAN